MKPTIHPKLVETKIICSSCGRVLKTLGTKAEVHTELCDKCHPFHTGKQVLVDTAGQVERFLKKQKVAKASIAQRDIKKQQIQKKKEEEKKIETLSNQDLLKKIKSDLQQEAKAKAKAKKK